MREECLSQAYTNRCWWLLAAEHLSNKGISASRFFINLCTNFPPFIWHFGDLIMNRLSWFERQLCSCPSNSASWFGDIIAVLVWWAFLWAVLRKAFIFSGKRLNSLDRRMSSATVPLGPQILPLFLWEINQKRKRRETAAKKTSLWFVDSK